MAKHIVKDAKLYLGEFDFSGLLSSAVIDAAAEVQDVTDHDSDSRQRMAGLMTWSFVHTSFWDQVPDQAWATRAVGYSGIPMLCAVPGTAGADGTQAYFGNVATSSYQLGGTVGDVHMAVGTGEGDGELIRGTTMMTGVKTASADGTGRELGAVAAGQKVYAVLLCSAASGNTPTLDVTIESDAADAWIGAETTRITFDQLTTTGYELASVDGAIADTWWRVVATIGAVANPSFTFVVGIGIK